MVGHMFSNLCSVSSLPVRCVTNLKDRDDCGWKERVSVCWFSVFILPGLVKADLICWGQGGTEVSAPAGSLPASWGVFTAERRVGSQWPAFLELLIGLLGITLFFHTFSSGRLCFSLPASDSLLDQDPSQTPILESVAVHEFNSFTFIVIIHTFEFIFGGFLLFIYHNSCFLLSFLSFISLIRQLAVRTFGIFRLRYSL